MPQTYPLLESNCVMCPHGGVVQLQSSTKDVFEVKGVGVITESDLQNAKILGCSNTFSPCALVATIPPMAISSLLLIDDSGAVLQSQVQSILTDKGAPLMLQGVIPNLVELDDRDSLASEMQEQVSQDTKDSNAQDQESTESSTDSSAQSSTESNADSTKEITEIYFSYGEKQTRLNDISRYATDVQIHIITQGYSDGEEVEVHCQTINETFSIKATIKNNRATIVDAFTHKQIPVGEIEIYA